MLRFPPAHSVSEAASSSAWGVLVAWGTPECANSHQKSTLPTVALDNIRIVLVEPKHPGNIGAVARAMKTMDLHRLYLVRPHEFPAIDAERRALGAVDILIHAKQVDDLIGAVSDCRLVIGGTSRPRTHSHPVLDARQAAEQIHREASRGDQVAVVFGTERTGLSNKELNICNFELRIPTSKDFRSLNLGSAVQLLAYEVFMASLETPPTHERTGDFPDARAFDHFHNHLVEVLDARGFFSGDGREVALLKLRRLFARCRPDVGELKLLHSLVNLMDRESDH